VPVKLAVKGTSTPPHNPSCILAPEEGNNLERFIMPMLKIIFSIHYQIKSQ
jgi:hypothetical protein